MLIFTYTCSTLLRVPSKHTTDIPINFGDDSSALISQHDDHTRPRKSSKGHHKCDHYGKLVHKFDRCYALNGRPPVCVVCATEAVELEFCGSYSI